MGTPLRILAWLYIVMGAISVILAGYFAYAIFGGGVGSFSAEIQQILVSAGYGTILLGLLVFASVGTFLAGLALLFEYRYAKSIAKVFAILGLLDFPFGTILGVFALWALSQKEGGTTVEIEAQ